MKRIMSKYVKIQINLIKFHKRKKKKGRGLARCDDDDKFRINVYFLINLMAILQFWEKARVKLKIQHYINPISII